MFQQLQTYLKLDIIELWSDAYFYLVREVVNYSMDLIKI